MSHTTTSRRHPRGRTVAVKTDFVDLLEAAALPTAINFVLEARLSDAWVIVDALAKFHEVSAKDDPSQAAVALSLHETLLAALLDPGASAEVPA